MQEHISIQVYKKYSSYKEQNLKGQYITLRDIEPLIEKLNHNERCEVEIVGKSVMDEPIHLIRYGKGSRIIFMWSQMHGNESTASRSVFDLLNFLLADDEFNDFRNKIYKELSVFIIPMVNPDGAEKYTRENALGIDLNRDARKRETPESHCLFDTMKKLKPHFGFNLHDQSNKYSAGDSDHTAVISLLAPPFNKENKINDVRKRAMQIAVYIKRGLESCIYKQIGRYDDEFEPRAFGENFQKEGVSTLLVEAGGLRNDLKREEVRKLFFYTLLQGIETILYDSFSSIDFKEYDEIPVNHERFFDLLIKNAKINWNGKMYHTDIGIKREVIGLKEGKDFVYKGIIEQIGDLDGFYGYFEYDAGGAVIEPGKLYPETLQKSEYIESRSLMKEGFSHVHVKEVPSGSGIRMPVNIVRPGGFFVNEIKPEKTANFFLKINDKIKMGVINGFLVDPEKDFDENINGLIL